MANVYSFEDAVSLAMKRLEDIKRTAKTIRDDAYAIRCFCDTLQMPTKDREALQDRLRRLSETAAQWAHAIHLGDR